MEIYVQRGIPMIKSLKVKMTATVTWMRRNMKAIVTATKRHKFQVGPCHQSMAPAVKVCWESMEACELDRSELWLRVHQMAAQKQRLLYLATSTT